MSKDTTQERDIRELIKVRGLKVTEEADTSLDGPPKLKFKAEVAKTICRIVVSLEQPVFTFVFHYKEHATDADKPRLRSAIVEFNSNIKLGSFQLDSSDGELLFTVRFKSFKTTSTIKGLLDVWDMVRGTVEQIPTPKALLGRASETAAQEEVALAKDIPKQVTECISKGICTASVTRKSYVTQIRMDCVTCGLTDNYGLCVSCSKKCHEGHDLRNSKLSGGFYCDCGMSDKIKCKCFEDRMTPMTKTSKDQSEGEAMLELLQMLRRALEQNERQPQMNVELSVDFKAQMGESFLIDSSKIKFVELKGQRKKLGSGAFGDVFEAVYADFYPVAVKRLTMTSTSDYEQFKKEARVMRDLQHDHIATFYGVAKLGSDICLIVALCNQGSLDSYIKQNRPVQLKCIEIAMEAAFILNYVHERGMIHRDVKLANFLMHNDHLKLADFGLTVTHRDAHKSIGGTLVYMAPELLLHDFTGQTNKIDVYAFGIVLWELLHPNQKPYPVSLLLDQNAFNKAIATGKRPEIYSRIPSPLAELLRSCWQSDARLRPSFSDIHKRLAEIKKELPSCTFL